MQGEAEEAGEAPAQAAAGVWPWIALAVVVVYFIAVALMTPVAPFGDDIDIANEAAAFGAAKTPGEAWSLLAAQHDEHRPVLLRLVFWAAAALPGAASYRLIALTGSLSLVLVFWLLTREARRVAAPAAVVVVLAALIFNFGSAEASIWAAAAIPNFGVIALILATLALLAGGGAWAVLALAPALLAVGMQGNGLLAPMLGAAFLLFNRRWGLAAVWALAAAAAAAWYFAGYVRPLDAPNPSRLLARLPEIMTYALVFCGSAAAFGSRTLGALNLLSVSVAGVIGAGLVLATMWGVLRGGLGRGRYMLWINVFVLLTSIAAALSRLDHGAQQALASRYHINSCLMIGATLLHYMGEDRELSAPLRRWTPALAMVGVVYVLVTAPILVWMHNVHAADTETPATSGGRLTPDPDWNLDRAALPAGESS